MDQDLNKEIIDLFSNIAHSGQHILHKREIYRYFLNFNLEIFLRGIITCVKSLHEIPKSAIDKILKTTVII